MGKNLNELRKSFGSFGQLRTRNNIRFFECEMSIEKRIELGYDVIAYFSDCDERFIIIFSDDVRRMNLSKDELIILCMKAEHDLVFGDLVCEYQVIDFLKCYDESSTTSLISKIRCFEEDVVDPIELDKSSEAESINE